MECREPSSPAETPQSEDLSSSTSRTEDTEPRPDTEDSETWPGESRTSRFNKPAAAYFDCAASTYVC